jgi:hypothetical protein
MPLGINQALSFVDPNVGWAASVDDCAADSCPMHLEETSDAGVTWHAIQVPLDA